MTAVTMATVAMTSVTITSYYDCYDYDYCDYDYCDYDYCDYDYYDYDYCDYDYCDYDYYDYDYDYCDYCDYCDCDCCHYEYCEFVLFAGPQQILPIPFPTPPPGEITVSTGQPMNTTIITLGTDVTIYCPSSGIDTPSIEWFRNSVMVVAGGRFTISTTTLPGAVITSVLRIDDFQGSDAGTYTCTATNVVGSDDGGTTLLGG